jgi:hypothetical protein
VLKEQIITATAVDLTGLTRLIEGEVERLAANPAADDIRASIKEHLNEWRAEVCASATGVLAVENIGVKGAAFKLHLDWEWAGVDLEEPEQVGAATERLVAWGLLKRCEPGFQLLQREVEALKPATWWRGLLNLEP